MTDLSLDDQMRSLLTKLRVTPEGTTASYNGSGNSKDSEEPGGKRPPGDTETRAEHYAKRYGPPFIETGGCATDNQRQAIIDEARAYLGGEAAAHARARVATETDEQRKQRMLTETEGDTPEEVRTSHWRTSPATLRMLRMKNGRHAETGKALVKRDTHDYGDEPGRARELRSEGKSLGQIAMLLGRPKATVQSWLDGRRRAA